MPCVIRKDNGERLETFLELAGEEWKLPPQVEVFEQWLQGNPELDTKLRWVADFGFCVRSDAAGGGAVISRELMQLCLASNMDIFLSEFPGEA